MDEEPRAPEVTRGSVRQSLESFAPKLANTRSVRPGSVILRLSGPGGGTYQLECGADKVQVTENSTDGVDTPPLIEVIGDAEVIRAILEGQADARKQFLAGGIRIRGNMRYLSDVALELGLLKHPL
jgi:putative sterol carrier protein